MAQNKDRPLVTRHLRIAPAETGAGPAPLWSAPQTITRRSDGAVLGEALPGGAPENGVFPLSLSGAAGEALAAEALTALLGRYFEQTDVFWAQLEGEALPPELAAALTRAGFAVTPQPGGRLLVEKPKSTWLAVGMCLGAGMGMSLGIAFGGSQSSGLSLGMCIGIAIGMAIGASIDARDVRRRSALRQTAALPPAPPRAQSR